MFHGWPQRKNYDTSTTNGRLNLNVKLAIAQDEADRDSDRVKFVFKGKLERGKLSPVSCRGAM